MTEPKNYKKGHHSYTRWGSKSKIVHVQGGKKEVLASQEMSQIAIEIENELENGVYSNLLLMHDSDEELILDFIFVHPGGKNGKVRSRVILPLSQVSRIKKILEAVESKFSPKRKK